ncbi:hypothetical protein KBC79_00440 [Candidatus Woesebacteria bacterium]|nr:hypothetical protein [Candidatus Woesebacteria bacterium]
MLKEQVYPLPSALQTERSFRPRSLAEVYDSYHIPDQLAEHMINVARVILWFRENLKCSLGIHWNYLVQAALKHDMGNIVRMENFFGPMSQEEEKWRAVQSVFRERYSSDAESATLTILKEMQVAPAVIYFVEGMGHTTIAEQGYPENAIEILFLDMADLAVSPTRICTQPERINEMRKRYGLKEWNVAIARRYLAYKYLRHLLTVSPGSIRELNQERVDWQKWLDSRLLVSL